MGYGIRKSKVKGIQHGIQSFTTSGVFTVPTGVRKIRVFLVGGGGGSGKGYCYSNNNSGSSGGAGSGYTKTTNYISVVKGQQLAVTVAPRSSDGGNGNASYVKYNNEYLVDKDGVSAVAYGGSASVSVSGNDIGPGADGGSGGGAGARYKNGDAAAGANGGIDGANGNYGSGRGWTFGGFGQGRTTREWGLPTGTLFARGGDGGRAYGVGGGSRAGTHGTDGLGDGASGCISSDSSSASYRYHGGSGYVAIEY